MQEELFTLKDIALQLDLPESTLRKYRDAFPEFIPTVGSGRDRRYTADAAAVFSAIRTCRTDEHLSWEDTSEHLAQKFPIDTEAGARGEPPPSVAERVPAAIQTATTLKKMEKEGAEQSFLLTTIGAELVKLSRGVDRITGAMDDLGVLRRTVLSQDNQIRNLSRIVAASLEDMQAWRQERTELQQLVSEERNAAQQQAVAPAPDRVADDERRRDLYAVLDRLGQLQSSMSFVVKQFERKTLDIEKKYEQINAIPTPAPTASAPAPGMDVAAVTEIQEQHKQEIARLRALLKERDEEISQLQGANRRLRIETDALKSRVSEMSRIEPAAAPAPVMRPTTLDKDKMAGGKLFFRGKKK